LFISELKSFETTSIPFGNQGDVVTTTPYVQRQPPPQPKPKDYLGLSIFSLFCFWPLGIVAILKSLESRSHYESGKYSEAFASSRSALQFSKLGIILGSVFLLVTVILTAVTIGIGVGVPLAIANGDLTCVRTGSSIRCN
jgi:hypothetical protein